MSVSAPNPPASGSSVAVQIAQYAVLAVVIGSVTVLIALGKVTAEAGLTLIGTLGGLHGGLALRG